MVEKKRKYIKKQHIPHDNDIERVTQSEISMTESDRITYIYKRDNNGKVKEVTNVSYDIKIRQEWVTIVRYDSSHGILHVHRKISLADLSETPTTGGVKKKGDHTKWLTWAISDIKRRFIDYKHGFLKRSRIKDVDID